MEQRERLIELVCDKLQDGCECYCNHPPCAQCKIIADHLLANGVVVPPVSVGDAVYIIDDTGEEDTDYVLGVTVTQFGCDIKGFGVQTKLPLGFKHSGYINSQSIGKTVFFTREEAEAELERRNK